MFHTDVYLAWLHNWMPITQLGARLHNRVSGCPTCDSQPSSYSISQVAWLLNYKIMLLQIAYIFKQNDFSAMLLLLNTLFFILQPAIAIATHVLRKSSLYANGQVDRLLNHAGIPVVSRHTVVCQRPRKQKKTHGTQVCYLLVP